MQSQTYKKKKIPFTNPLTRSNHLLLFTCSLAVLPVCVCVCVCVCVRSIPPPHRGYRLEACPQRITVTENHTHLFYTVNTSTHSTLHIYTPCLLICSVLVCLFWFVLFFSSRSVSVAVRDLTHHAQTCLIQQNMSVTGRIWKYG